MEVDYQDMLMDEGRLTKVREADLSVRASNTLANAGYVFLVQSAVATEGELLRKPNLG